MRPPGPLNRSSGHSVTRAAGRSVPATTCNRRPSTIRATPASPPLIARARAQNLRPTSTTFVRLLTAAVRQLDVDRVRPRSVPAKEPGRAEAACGRPRRRTNGWAVDLASHLDEPAKLMKTGSSRDETRLLAHRSQSTARGADARRLDHRVVESRGRCPPEESPAPILKGGVGSTAAAEDTPTRLGLCLLAVTRLGVDRPQVGLVVWSAFGQRDDVIDLGRTRQATNMTRPAVAGQHPATPGGIVRRPSQVPVTPGRATMLGAARLTRLGDRGAARRRADGGLGSPHFFGLA